MRELIDVGLYGCGIVGNALRVWLQENNSDVRVNVYDPQKGYNRLLPLCDIYFIQVTADTLENGKVDISNIEQCIEDILSVVNSYDDYEWKKGTIPIFVRSTITPSDIETLEGYFYKSRERIVVFYMPEFLTSNTAIEDFKRNPVVCTTYDPVQQELFRKVFKGKEIIQSNSFEASVAKYCHNVFAALKITYFNAMKDLCERCNYSYGDEYSYEISRNIKFDDVKKILDSTGHISPMYTQVPGPDGKKGYGGSCFPKDIRAAMREFHHTYFADLIAPIDEINNMIRNNGFKSDESFNERTKRN